MPEKPTMLKILHALESNLAFIDLLDPNSDERLQEEAVERIEDTTQIKISI
jgi:hypothetical protein